MPKKLLADAWRATMARLSDFLLCGWRLLFSISAPGRGSGKPPCKQRYAPTWLWGLDAPTTARTVGLPPRGGPVLSFEAKESTKESQRHGDSRGGPPRCALFANIGVPGTAVPGSCICSGLPVANCLRQLCPLGTRSLSAQASVCGSRTVGCPE